MVYQPKGSGGGEKAGPDCWGVEATGWESVIIDVGAEALTADNRF